MQASRVTPFLVLQFCVALLVLALASFRPGEWNTLRWAGLIIAILAAVPLFVARYQLGKSFSVTPQARELVTYGIDGCPACTCPSGSQGPAGKFGDAYRDYRKKTWF